MHVLPGAPDQSKHVSWVDIQCVAIHCSGMDPVLDPGQRSGSGSESDSDSGSGSGSGSSAGSECCSGPGPRSGSALPLPAALIMQKKLHVDTSKSLRNLEKICSQPQFSASDAFSPNSALAV